MTLGDLRPGDRGHHPALDEVLLPVHTGQVVPEPAGQDLAAHVDEHIRLGRLDRHDLVEVGDRRPASEAGVGQPLGQLLLLGQHVGQDADPTVDQTPFKPEQ